MPNYAYTSHYIEGAKEEISALYNAISSADNHPDRDTRIKEYYGHLWHGYILQELCNTSQELDLRGQITGYSLISENCLNVETESAWSAPTDIHEFLKNLFPSFVIYYFMWPNDEGDMITNDIDRKYFSSRFGVDMEDEDEVFFDTEAELFSWVSNKTGTSVSTIEEARNAIDDYCEDNDCWMSLHECYEVQE